MAIQDQQTLEASSIEVRDETGKKANTALRIGTLFLNFLQTIFAYLDQKVDKIAIIDSIDAQVGNSWRTAGISFTSQTIDHTTLGELTIDFSLGKFVIVNLTANVTSIAFTTPADGQGQVLFVQDDIGSRVINFEGLKSIDGAIPDYSVEANAESLIDVTTANASTYVFGAGNLKLIA